MGEQITVKVKEKEVETPFAELEPLLEVEDNTYLEGGISTSYWGPIDNIIIAESEQDIIAVEPAGKRSITWGRLKAAR